MNPIRASDVIVQEITIKASAKRIFEALTDPGERVRWWGAEGRFQATHMESDLRPGGKWTMRGVGMGGKPFSVRGVYREIERPRESSRALCSSPPETFSSASASIFCYASLHHRFRR